MTYSKDIIKVLIYIRLLCRKKNILKSIFEVLMPVLLFLLAFSLQNYITDSKKGKNDHNTYPIHQDELFYMFSNTPVNVAYTSNTSKFVRDLMTKAIDKIDLQSSYITSYENENVLLNDLGNILKENTKYMAVIFDNYGDDIPKSINYTIRNSAAYDTYKIKPTSIVSGPHENNGVLYEKFSTLQLAIDTTYIEMASSKNLSKKTLLQSFPYPPYNRDEGWSIKYNVLLSFITINSYLFLIIAIVARILVEKASGIKELMKMMGLPEKYLWISYYIDSMFFQIISLSIAIFFLKRDSLVPYTSGVVLFLTFFIYTNYVIMFSFALSTLLSDSTLANLLAVLIWLFSQLSHLLDFKEMENCAYIFMLLPNAPIFQMYNIIRVREFQDTGVQLHNLFTPIGGMAASSYGVILLILLFKTFLLLPVIYLMNRVNPGPYGTPKSLLSIFKKSKRTCSEISELSKQDETYFEEFVNSTAEISIRRLTKCYIQDNGYTTVALSNVSFDIYKNGITALLGHNGAGKTTLMSIITGMQPSTSGKVYIDCYDTSNAMDKIHDIIGLCPQQNMTFPFLTVEEHVLLFAKIRGLSNEDANKECERILGKLNLLLKKDEMCTSISGGAQRRLQLAIALAGHPKVLILDEPTSGLDPKNRREIWDILLELRKDHTILLTTHFMEEANVLGDNIAILDRGVLKCYGTSIFLKKNICNGFKLTILKNPEVPHDLNNKGIKLTILEKPEVSHDLIDSKIKNFINDFDVETKNDILIYSFTTDDFDLKLQIINTLEDNKEALGITTFSLSPSTLEEVFLKICSEGSIQEKNRLEHAEIQPNNLEGGEDEYDFSIDKENGLMANNFNIFIALTKKKIRFMITKLKLFVSFFFLLIILLIISVRIYDSEESVKLKKNPPIILNPSIYGKRELLVPYSSLNSSYVPEYSSKLTKLKFESTNDTYKDILERGRLNILDYFNTLLFGFSFDENDVTVFYTTSIYHTLPVAINTLSNIIASDLLGSNPVPYISVSNYPIDEHNLIEESIQNKPDHLIIAWAFLITMGFKLFTSLFLLLPTEEQISGARELQLMTGINKSLYWLSYYFLDLFICIISLLLFIGIMHLEIYSTITSDALGPLTLILIFYFIAILSLIYLASYFIKEVAAGFVYIITLNVFSGFLALIIYMQLSFNVKNVDYLNIIQFFTGFIYPAIHLDLGFLKIGHLARERFICIQQHNLILTRFNYTNPPDYCCERDEITGECSGLPDYYSDPKFGVSSILIYLGTYSIVTMLLLFLDMTNITKPCNSKVSNSNASSETAKLYDSPLLVDNVSKRFVTRGDHISEILHIVSNKKVNAVNEVNFELNKGECFGLIGLNGAGKTTTFKILTNTIKPDQGKVSIFGTLYEQSRKKYLSNISYCPQFDAVCNYLTGRQVLTLFSTLRKVKKSEIARRVDSLLKMLEITKYADIPVEHYSGGNKRKLSLAVALIGFNSKCGGVILLDEPTSGVDPMSRRVLHNVIQKAIKAKITIVLSSHNMEECELLCDRLGIMVEGKMFPAENVLNIKKKYGFGYSLTIKLKVKNQLPVDFHGSMDSDLIVTDGPSSIVTDNIIPLTKMKQKNTGMDRDVVDSSFPLRHESAAAENTNFDDDLKDKLVTDLKNEIGQIFPNNCKLQDEHKSILQYYIKNSNKYSDLFSKMQSLKKNYGNVIEDFNISDTTLEEAFISGFTQQEELSVS